MHAEGKLPAELVSLILSYTTIRDVVRWRRVSKSFHSVTHDPRIWSALYMNAPFLRPRKPFLNNASFEDALVHSARLGHSWLTQPLRTMPPFQIPLDGYISECWKHLGIIDGKWLPICQELRRFVLCEITANDSEKASAPQVLFESEEEFSEWDYSVGTLKEGKWLVYILLFTEPSEWKCLEIHVDAESGASCDAIDLNIPVMEPKARPVQLDLGETLGARSPFLWIEAQSLVFDTRTRTFYRFPEFHITKPSIRSRVDSDEGSPLVVPTNTHIIAMYFYPSFPELSIVVQAFTIPCGQSAVEQENNVLHLSHEGIYSYCLASRYPIAIIRNSTVDPMTGSTSIKLLERSWKYDGFHGVCTELTLHAPSAGEVAPMTIKMSDLVIRGNIPPYPIHNVSYSDIFHDICDEGYARGFFIQGPFNGPRGVVKYTLDATRDGCVAVLGRFSPVDFDSNLPSRSSFDCVRGRICHTSIAQDVPPLTVMDFE